MLSLQTVEQNTVLSATRSILGDLSARLRAAKADRQSLAVGMAHGAGLLNDVNERSRELFQTVRALFVLLRTI